ncbi:hypothetical protein DFH01_22355 [Falsiroseomonas bella]|uniref:Uncharacterized protein n=1 Tax=Falsiroseomonas bella TaxID=2184016 RepID=A0A317FBZ5_9PROT|nr:hypothetical protein [Falsiroseomonas bella]PWS35066.1 hypothetical protein DFH01_22355 [Falsiroseomonas bella]
MRTMTILTAAAAAALIGGTAAAQPARDPNYGPHGRGDPFGQEQVNDGRGWYEGPMAQYHENQRGRSWEFDRAYRENFNRGYQAGMNDERMARERYDRDRAMRDRDMGGMGRATFDEARDYLGTARRQIDQGDLRSAWVSLGRAETRLVTRVDGRDQGGQAVTGGAVGAIREARQALRARDADRAEDLTRRAEALVRRGYIGETVSGNMLSGAGEPGMGRRFYNERSGGN